MSSINKKESSDINRGVELIIRRKKPKKKTFSFSLTKMVSFFKKEITIFLDFSFDIKDQNKKGDSK
jgi:hypothetical protein